MYRNTEINTPAACGSTPAEAGCPGFSARGFSAITRVTRRVQARRRHGDLSGGSAGKSDANHFLDFDRFQSKVAAIGNRGMWLFNGKWLELHPLYDHHGEVRHC